MTSILDKSFVYHNAASHGDPLAFRERMQHRLQAAKDWREERARRAQWEKPEGGGGGIGGGIGGSIWAIIK